jgi:hypothetical protein
MVHTHTHTHTHAGYERENIHTLFPYFIQLLIFILFEFIQVFIYALFNFVDHS